MRFVLSQVSNHPSDVDLSLGTRFRGVLDASRVFCLPAAVLHHVGFCDVAYGEALHCTETFFAGFGEDGWVVEVRGGAHDGAGTGFGFGTLFAAERIAAGVKRGLKVCGIDVPAWRESAACGDVGRSC